MDAKDAMYVLGGIAVVVFFIVRQRRSDRFRERSLLFPVALGIYGVVLLTDTTEHQTLTAASAVLLVLSAAASIGFGVIRGRTIELFSRGGEAVGARVVDDDRRRLGRPPRHTNRADRRRCCDRRQGRRVAHLDPADARRDACGADAGREGERGAREGCRRADLSVAQSVEALA